MPEMIRKIYIDPRFRTPQSKSTSDFEVELANSVVIPRKAIGWVSDLHLPVSFYNVDEHNNVLYVRASARYGSLTASPTVRVKADTLPPKNYSGETLAEELATQLNVTSLMENSKFYTRYVPEEGCIHFAFGKNITFEGSYTRSGVAASLTGAAGDWGTGAGGSQKTWVADPNDAFRFTHSGDRIVTFTALNQFDGTAEFIETNTAGNVNYTFTYDASLQAFTSPSVAWNYEPPGNFSWNGIKPESVAKLTKVSEGVFNIADPSGNVLPNWTGGTVAYEQGDVLIFGGALVAVAEQGYGFQFFSASGSPSGTLFSWSPISHSMHPSRFSPLGARANFVKESALRDNKSPEYLDFTIPSAINNNTAFHIDPNNVRSINEDVLLAGYNQFHRRFSTPLDLKSSVLNLLGHGAPIYITSPDISSLNSIGPQGERGILAKVSSVEDFGRVITHSPFAEMDYFKANTAILKRLRFVLRFSSGAVVNLHHANFSFSNIFQEAE